MSNLDQKQRDLVLKWMFVDQISGFKTFVNENKNSISVDNFSSTYGIYNVITYDKVEGNNHTTMPHKPDFKILSYKPSDVIEMMVLIDEAMNLDSFYGCLAVFGDEKIPMNPLSYNFIDNFNKYKDQKDFLFSIYIMDENIKVENNIKEETIEKISNIDIKKFKIDNRNEDSEISLYCKLTRDYECVNNNMHLDNFHIKVEDPEKLITVDKDILINCESGDNSTTEKFLSDNSWSIELTVIDSGVIIPSYGWFKKEENGNLHSIVSSTLHPNISLDGESYCTGINTKHSIIGVSELTYGNLNSPMNTDIWIKDMLSIAKGFQEVYYVILKNMEF